MKNTTYILLTIILLILIYYAQTNLYKSLNLPLTHYTLNWFDKDDDNKKDDSIYELHVFKSLSKDYMLILEPQNFHLFVEDASTIIYHPRRKIENKQDYHYYCPESYELAYAIQEIPKITCHRPLEYLKTFVFTEKIYTKTFNEIQNPLDIIHNFFKTIQKIEGINSIIHGKF